MIFQLIPVTNDYLLLARCNNFIAFYSKRSIMFWRACNLTLSSVGTKLVWFPSPTGPLVPFMNAGRAVFAFLLINRAFSQWAADSAKAVLCLLCWFLLHSDPKDKFVGTTRGGLGLETGWGLRHPEGSQSRAAASAPQRGQKANWGVLHLGEEPRVEPGQGGRTDGWVEGWFHYLHDLAA